MRLRELPERLAIVRLGGEQPVPAWAFAGTGLAAVVRRAGELSVICDEDAIPPGTSSVRPWAALEVVGPIDLAATGVMADLSAALAGARVPLFAVSTHDTDVLLVRAVDVERATDALEAAGHAVERAS